MIALHFAALMFLPFTGALATVATFIALSALIWAGLLFMWASVPYRKEHSSFLILSGLLGVNTLYIGILTARPSASLVLAVAAVLIGVLPLTLALMTLRTFNHPLRWILIALYCALSIFLLAFQHRPGNGAELAMNAVLFTVYFGCCIYFWYTYRRATTGALITVAGFLAWAAVFVVAPGMGLFLPNFHLESEVWNLPKYIVAVGMILLALENQIEHNKHLALHDELTGLPNRRLFQDRLTYALDRARHSGTHMALLLIDLDRFKQVNDTLGHHVGDLLLERVAAIFYGRIRSTDTVARTGGDEFAVILEEPTCREDAEKVSSSLTHLLKDPIDLGSQTLRISASVGIALFPDDATTLEALCIAADLSMYAEKRKSRGKVPGGQFMPGAFPGGEVHSGLELAK